MSHPTCIISPNQNTNCTVVVSKPTSVCTQTKEETENGCVNASMFARPSWDSGVNWRDAAKREPGVLGWSPSHGSDGDRPPFPTVASFSPLAKGRAPEWSRGRPGGARPGNATRLRKETRSIFKKKERKWTATGWQAGRPAGCKSCAKTFFLCPSSIPWPMGLIRSILLALDFSSFFFAEEEKGSA